jgi:hypothetical protein
LAVGSEAREGYARLPEDLLQELLEGAGEVVDNVHQLLGPALDKRDDLRRALEQLGLVQQYIPVEPATLSGVDGGFAVERTVAVDLVLSVAVGVEGLAGDTTPWDGTQYKWWTHVMKHDSDSERLARGVMVAQELEVIHKAPHGLRILDGSHLTLVIQLNSGLTSMSHEVRREARKVWESLSTSDALAAVCSETEIVAMPKYDSSRVVTEQLEAALGEPIPGDDKYLMGLLLEPGELVTPQRVPNDPWSLLHFDARQGDEDLRDAFEAAIAPLQERSIAFTYFKPEEFAPAFRIEVKHPTKQAHLDVVCSTIASQITGPFIREPYPQYLADVMAKSVGLGLSALKTAVQLGLGSLGRPEIAELLIQSYRTEGV